MKCSRELSLLAVVAALATATAANSAPRAAIQANDNPNQVEVVQYRLTMDKAEKAAASAEAINKMLAADAGLKRKVDAANAGNVTIDQSTKEIDTVFPQLAAIIHGNGLATREYVVVTFALMNDLMVVGMKRQGVFKDYPPSSITPGNASFVEQNFDKLQALGKKIVPPDSK